MLPPLEKRTNAVQFNTEPNWSRLGGAPGLGADACNSGDFPVIRLSRMTDYGVVVMSQMNQHDGTMTAPELAQATGLPVPTVSKLLKQLAKAGLVESHRGVHGGYSMERDLDDINAMEIIEALDGPVALTDCVDGAEDMCNVQSLCPMRGGWDKVNQAVRKALTEVSLAELCPPRVFLEPGATSIARSTKKTVAR